MLMQALVRIPGGLPSLWFVLAILAMWAVSRGTAQVDKPAKKGAAEQQHAANSFTLPTSASTTILPVTCGRIGILPHEWNRAQRDNC
jgi:hypothetical protein